MRHDLSADTCVLHSPPSTQDILVGTGSTDASGNPVLEDIGLYMKTEIKKYFKGERKVHPILCLSFNSLWAKVLETIGVFIGKWQRGGEGYWEGQYVGWGVELGGRGKERMGGRRGVQGKWVRDHWEGEGVKRGEESSRVWLGGDRACPRPEGVTGRVPRPEKRGQSVWGEEHQGNGSFLMNIPVKWSWEMCTGGGGREGHKKRSGRWWGYMCHGVLMP